MRVVPKSCTPTLKWFGNYGLLCASFEIEVMMYKPKSKKLNEFFCSPFIKGCEVLHFIIWMKNSSTDAMCMKKVIYTNFSLTQRGSIELIYIVWYFSIFSFFSRYWCWCCHWHHLVLCFCLLNLFIFHRAARNLLEDFVGIYLDGNSSFLQETVDKKCLQFEVNISFMLSICKHEICSFIMWTAICLGYIYIYLYILNFLFIIFSPHHHGNKLNLYHC